MSANPEYLRGMSRLAFDATLGLTGVVEAMHHNISRRPGILGSLQPGRTHLVTGLVYGSIRGVMRLVGSGVDLALRGLEPLAAAELAPIGRQAWLAALNGVVGDQLEATGNPLAIRMRLVQGGVPLDFGGKAPPAASRPTARLLVLVHGLCMNDRGWDRPGHDHGAALARDLGYTPLHLVYNSGLHVSRNGRQLAELLEAATARWPVPVKEISILGHSMGGLVARSACHYAAATRHRWPGKLRSMVFLGTPHHGAPLERAGNWVDLAIGLSPYTAPLTRLGKVRSEGITDLRYGNLLDEDWQGRDRFQVAPSARIPVPLPENVQCYAVAGTLRGKRGCAALVGDGLVPLDSALGRHPESELSLAFPRSHLWIARGIGHIDLLGRPEVCDRIRRWLEKDPR
jgi:pimeloyl-ACP methyl ester carboxylesterase